MYITALFWAWKIHATLKIYPYVDANACYSVVIKPRYYKAQSLVFTSAAGDGGNELQWKPLLNIIVPIFLPYF